MEKNNNFRCCKVVATYFGKRRFYPANADDTIEMLKDFVIHEKNIDSGVKNLDIIFVNHNCGNTKGNKFLDELNGERIRNGTIKVLHRPWDDGKGISLRSFDYAFKLLDKTYDYWFFQEDDYKIMHTDYYIKGINILEKEENTAYVGYDMYFWEGIIKDNNLETIEKVFYKDKINRRALIFQLNFVKVIFILPLMVCGYYGYIKSFLRTIKKTKELIKKGELPFCSGMMGLTHTKFLTEVINKYDNLPFPNIPMSQKQKEFKKINIFTRFNYILSWVLLAVLGEIEFTRIYKDLGYNIKSYDNLKDLIFSYKKDEFKK